MPFQRAACEILSVQRRHAFLIVLVCWAAIYLSGLGRTELKGEEGRRILPALTMLQTHEWLVPYVGGQAFLRKPPLVNWLIAGAFKLTGTHHELAARLPSALTVLALAATLVLLSGRAGWLKPEAALVAALFFLTQVATIEKGRLAEIEAIYFGVSGLAIACWLACWAQERSPWQIWVLPCFFLGLGLLAKGPAHLLFFYAIVVCVLWHAGEMRRLLHPAHFVGILVMLGIFGAWYWPYHQTEAGLHATEVWRAQSLGRVTGKFDFAGWAMNIPRGLSNHLPWILFAPVLWRRDLAELGKREGALFRGTRLAVVTTFFGVLLVPGMLPRYTLPLLAPFAILLAYALADERLAPRVAALRAWWRANLALGCLVGAAAFSAPAVFSWGRGLVLANPARFPGMYGANFAPVLLSSACAAALAVFVVVGRNKLARPALIATASGALTAAAALLYAAVGIPFVTATDHLRPTARRIDGAVPAGKELVIYDPEYQPVIFYLEVPYRYAPDMVEIPPADAWVLTRAEKLKKLARDRPDLQVVAEFPRPLELVLLHGT